MRSLRTLFVFSAASLIVGAVACQSYEFDQVTPKAIGTVKQPTPIAGVQKAPKIMLVIDKSGSMKTTPDSDTNWGCCQSAAPNCIGYSPTGSCKWNSLRDLLVTSTTGFLDSTKDGARIGLAMFPNKGASVGGMEACAEGAVEVEVGSGAGDTVSAIKTGLEAIAPNGGTPTAALLQTLAKDLNSPFMKDETATKRYVVLITDGLPNCNPSIGACTACSNTSGDTNPATWCGDKKNCVDDIRVVDAVKYLKSKGVETFVIGFGSGINNPAARSVLDRAAEAGGKAQSGQDTKFYQASNQADLEKVLNYIKTVIQKCTFDLSEAPSSEKTLEVSVSDVAGGDPVTLVKGTDWDFVPDTALKAVQIKEPWCGKLQAAEANKYTLIFVSVKELK